MLHVRDFTALSISMALFMGLACAKPEAGTDRAADLRAQLEGWKGRPLSDFLSATHWKPTRVIPGIRASDYRMVEFNATGAGPASGPMTATYHHVTPWAQGQPGVTTTTGMNQPLDVPPATATVRTETVRIPSAPAGCKLILWVNGEGLVHSWRLEGSDCSKDTLDRLRSE